MPTFYLEPKDAGSGDPNWDASTLKEGLWVSAQNDTHARQLAESATNREVNVLQRGRLFSPWRNLGLTSCRIERRHFNFPAGKILTKSGKILDA